MSVGFSCSSPDFTVTGSAHVTSRVSSSHDISFILIYITYCFYIFTWLFHLRYLSYYIWCVKNLRFLFVFTIYFCFICLITHSSWRVFLSNFAPLLSGSSSLLYIWSLHILSMRVQWTKFLIYSVCPYLLAVWI